MPDSIDHLLRATWTSDGGHATKLPAAGLRWLFARTGAPAGTAPSALPSVPAGESALPPAARDALISVLGAEHVLLDAPARLGRAGGLSYVDLLRRRSGADVPVPDAVVLPGDSEQVQRVVSVCAEHDIGVVPFGGGTSVVGGVAALRGDKRAVVVVDLVRLDGLLSVDPVSRLAVFQAGVRAPDAERMLRERGLTLGHVPQSFERATIGGFAATRSAGQASAGYGRFEDMVAHVRLATPRGDWRLGVAPASAAGPDLRQLAIGSEGSLGVLTEIGVRVRPLPVVHRYEGVVLDGWERGCAAVRELAQQRVLADVTRLSDVDESAVSLALKGGWQIAALRRYLRARGVAEPCLLVLGWEAHSKRELYRRRADTLRALRPHAPVRLGRSMGEAWRHGRFAGPRQRDALLDAGVCVETLETATYWSRLSELRGAVRGALRGSLSVPGREPMIMCHVSHAYETGASLYFTVLVPRATDDPIGQWEHAKAAACAAITSGHDHPLGTISHHHAVGVDHAPYLSAEIGELGVDVLRGLKNTLDPSGVLNPGKLVR